MKTLSTFAVLAVLLLPRPAAAQGFIAPFVGWNFGGDAKCLELTDCEDRSTSWGVAFGALGPVLGFEEEFAYTKDFFGESPDYGSDVLTLMSNLVISAPIPAVRPYVLGGVGLIKSKIEPTLGSLASFDNNSFGWDLGGGVIVGGEHVGVRGDLRYFHTFQDLELAGIPLTDNQKLNFGRASLGLFLKF